MKYFFRHCMVIILIACYLFSGDVQAQVNTLGQDTYAVFQDARLLPNGDEVPSTVFNISRPAVGTTLPGVVYVKSRAARGTHNKQSILHGSTINITMQPLGIVEVNSAFSAETTPRDGAKLASVLGLDRIYLVRYSEPMEAFDVCRKLMSDPDVEYAVPVFIHKVNFTPNDPRYVNQGYLQNMKLAEAWDISKGDKKTIIAIVDSGTDWTHEDLTDQIFKNTKEIPDNNIDDDGNGYVDDVRGWDFVGNVSTNEVLNGIFRPDNDPKVYWNSMSDLLAHGTMTAGLAAASTNNGKGIASAGFNCTILPLKCGSDNPGPGGIFKGYDAIRYAADMGAHIINCSWGGPGVDPIGQEVINYATGRGALVVGASGNDGLDNDSYLQTPSSYRGVLGVGSVGNNDVVSNFSNYGWVVGVYAPGESTLSTYPANQYKASTGTSFSSPIVSGIAGLVKSLHPTWTPEMIYHQIRSTSDILAQGVGANRPKYYGRANALRALTINSSFSNGERLPGIGVSRFNVVGGTTITSFNPTSINFTFKNYLAEAAGTTVNFSMLSNGVSATSAADVTIGTIANNASSQQTVTIQLKPSFPWYSTFIDIGITIRSGVYTNFERIRIPVLISTSNSYTTLAAVANTQFTQGSIAFDGSYWATGSFFNNSIYARLAASGGQGLNAIPFSATAVAGIDGNTALIGGIRAGAAKIARTTNGGGQWPEVDVSTSMKSVVGIAMWDANNGIAIGNPVATKLGAVKTTNGGAVWTALSTAPVLSAGETVIAGSSYSNANGMWFGTSTDRVVYTTNQGVNWGAGPMSIGAGQIISVAFSDNNKGCALYRVAGAGSAVKIASSTTGGSSWTLDVFTPSTLDITAVRLASPGGHILLVGSGGEVFATGDFGKTWQAVLSQPAGNVVACDSRLTNRNTVAFVGARLSTLQYSYINNNGTKILENNSITSDFGIVPLGSSRQRYLQFKSAGESPVNVTGYKITPKGATADTAYQITFPLDEAILPGTTDQLGIRFYASDTGTFIATLTVLSNSETPVAESELTARVDPPVSVEEEMLLRAVMHPNPASTELTFQVEGLADVYIHNLQSELMMHRTLAGSHFENVDVRGLPAGLYQVTISNKIARTARALVISR